MFENLFSRTKLITPCKSLVKAREEFTNRGFTLIPAHLVGLSNEEWGELDNLTRSNTIPKIDFSTHNPPSNKLYKRFFDTKDDGIATDHDSLRTYNFINSKIGELLRKVLGEVDFKHIFGQINILWKGGDMGEHIDNYPPPPNQFSVVIHLDRNYGGGDFYLKYQEKTFKLSHAERCILIFKSDILHGVREVTKGERRTVTSVLLAENTEEEVLLPCLRAILPVK